MFCFLLLYIFIYVFRLSVKYVGEIAYAHRNGLFGFFWYWVCFCIEEDVFVNVLLYMFV